MGIIEKEEIPCDLGVQGEILRRFCTWLELCTDLGREHFMLTLMEKEGQRAVCLGGDGETDWARG